MLRANRQPALSMGAATTDMSFGRPPSWSDVIVIRLSLNMVIPVHHFQLIHDGHLIMVVILIIFSLYMVLPLHHFQLIHDRPLKLVVIVIIFSLYMVMPLHLLFGIMGVAPSSLLYKVILYEWVTS